jgi:cell division protease FtsH
VAKSLPESDPVHKISIVPRGHQALGYTLQLPEEDRFLISRAEMLNRISIFLGGRVAEELTFDDVTGGAANDLDRSTKTARQMVTELGMSDRLGLVKLGRKHSEIFLGRDISEDRDYSEEVAYAIDQEVKAIVDSCYARAKEILSEKRELLDSIAEVLLDRETLDGEEFEALMNGEELPEKPEKKPSNNGGEKTEAPETGEPEETEVSEAEKIPDLPEERTDGVPKNEFLA